GILATIVTKSITNSYVFNIISHLLLVGAGILFLLAAFSQLFKKISINFCSMPKWLVNWSTKLLPENRLFASYLLGVMLGFLPCHLVYAAIAAVASTGSPIDATIGMIAFAVGTMPTLIFIGLGGRVLLQRQYFWLKPTSIILMLINGIMLFVMAGKGFV
ncbi:MAG: sulfite exporter TauE/SafE family protein, partial [Pseudomonadota bacterium]